MAAFIAAGFTPQQLIEGAKARDPGLQDEDFEEAALWVDDSADEVLPRTWRNRARAAARCVNRVVPAGITHLQAAG